MAEWYGVDFAMRGNNNLVGVKGENCRGVTQGKFMECLDYGSEGHGEEEDFRIIDSAE